MLHQRTRVPAFREVTVARRIAFARKPRCRSKCSGVHAISDTSKLVWPEVAQRSSQATRARIGSPYRQRKTVAVAGVTSA